MNFLPIAFSLILGIYSSPYLPLASSVIAGIVIFIICLIRMRRNPRTSEIAALCIVFITGACLYRSGTACNISEGINEYVTAEGIICEMPYSGYGTNYYVLLCRQLNHYGGVSEPNAKIYISSDESFKCGESVSVHGKLIEISDDDKSYGFDSKRSYASRGIYTRMYALSAKPSETKYKCHSVSFYSNMLRSWIKDLIYSRCGGDTAAAMTAVITGFKGGFSDDYEALLSRTSMRSMYYPAFAHILLLISLVELLAEKVSKRRRDLVLVIVLALYTFYSLSNPSSVKCAAAFIIMIVIRRLTGTGNLTNSLCLYVIISLLINPMLLYNSAYIISCSSTLLLDRFRYLFKSKSPLKTKLLRGMLLFAGMLPLYAYFIGHASLYAYTASLIFVPLTAIVILLSPFFCINCLLGTEEYIGSVTVLLTNVQMKLPAIIDKLPFSYMALPRPSLIFLGTFYIGAAAYWYFLRKRTVCARFAAAVSAGLALSCLVSVLSDAGKIRLDFIDVGQGDAALIHIPFSGNILIDGGGRSEYSSYNIGRNVFVPYLTSHGAMVIQAAFVSHYHNDHCEGIIEALKTTHVLNLFLPDSLPESELRAELEKEAKAHNTRIWYVSAPLHVSVNDADLYVYPPDRSVTDTGIENDTSLFIDLRCGSFSCAFTGDMTAKGERFMVNIGAVQRSDVLKVSHHGSPTSTCNEFVNAVQPKLSLIGVGKNNNFHFPDAGVLDRLSESEVYRTDLDGTISIYAKRNGEMKVKTEK